MGLKAKNLLIVWTLCAFSQQINAAVVQFFGDVFISKRATDNLGKREAGSPFEKIEPLLKNADFNLANLEGVLGAFPLAPKTEKAFLLSMNPALAEVFSKNHLHAFTLANNHSMDFGVNGLESTRKFLNAQSILNFGVGANLDEALQPLTKKIGDENFCFFGISRVHPEEFWATDSRAGVANPPIDRLKPVAKACKDSQAILVAVIHWGTELSSTISGYQKQLSKDLFKLGFDAIIGHHPHILQKVDVVSGKYVFYSLGNFVFTSIANGPQSGGAVRMITNGKGQIEKFELVPLHVAAAKTKFQTEVAETDEWKSRVSGMRNCTKDKRHVYTCLPSKPKP